MTIRTAGSTFNFDLSSTNNGTNDRIIMSSGQNLALNGNAVHIKAPSVSVGLDQTADYILVTNTGSGVISGTCFSTPVFDVAPTNGNHFIIVTTSKAVTLHYTTTAYPSFSSVSVAPSGNLVRNQSVNISVTAVQGSAPITNVFLNLSSLGGSASIPMAQQSGNVYTNTISIPPASLAGVQSALAEAQDMAGNTGIGLVALPVVTSIETWTGGAAASFEF